MSIAWYKPSISIISPRPCVRAPKPWEKIGTKLQWTHNLFIEFVYFNRWRCYFPPTFPSSSHQPTYVLANMAGGLDECFTTANELFLSANKRKRGRNIAHQYQRINKCIHDTAWTLEDESMSFTFSSINVMNPVFHFNTIWWDCNGPKAFYGVETKATARKKLGLHVRGCGVYVTYIWKSK